MGCSRSRGCRLWRTSHGLHRGARAPCACLSGKERLQGNLRRWHGYGGARGAIPASGRVPRQNSPGVYAPHGHDEYATPPQRPGSGRGAGAVLRQPLPPQRYGADHGKGADRPGGLRALRPGAPQLREGGAGGVERRWVAFALLSKPGGTAHGGGDPSGGSGGFAGSEAAPGGWGHAAGGSRQSRHDPDGMARPVGAG